MTRPRPDWTPAPRDGVNASRVAVSGGPWHSVLHFLTTRMPAGADWPDRLARGDVLDSRGQALAADAPCPAPTPTGTVLWYWRSLPPEPRVPGEVVVLHQDAQLVVVDKPHFLPVTPGGRYVQETVLVRLQRQLGLNTLVPVHRLDLETAGVMLFTVPADTSTRRAYQALFRNRQVHKLYEAVTPWRDGIAWPVTCRHRLQPRPGADFMQMQVEAGEPNAETTIALIARLPGNPASGGDRAWLSLRPRTGRKHQLRAQLNALGLPIVGDRIYPHLWPERAADAAPDVRNPLQLLAREIAFTDPFSGQVRRYTSQRQLWLVAGRPHADPDAGEFGGTCGTGGTLGGPG